MAYIIQFLNNKLCSPPINQIIIHLNNQIEKDNRFKCLLDQEVLKSCIVIKNIRLINKKEYCGQHPGECQVSNKPKKKMSFLEWNDWIEFNNLINSVLNKYKVNANVFSMPYDVKGKFWIRKGFKARLHYDWTEDYNKFGNIIRIWNNGTDDQFEKKF